MKKPYYTRKDLIAISLALFFAFVLIFVGMCLEGTYSFVSSKNPIAAIGKGLNFKVIECGISGFICLVLVALYVAVFAAVFLYERRFAIVNNKKPTHITMILLYAGTFILSVVFSLGVGLILQINLKQDIKLLLQYIGQSMVLGSLLYLLLFGLLAFATMLVVNFINVDKPFKFWDKKEKTELEDIKEEVQSQGRSEVC